MEELAGREVQDGVLGAAITLRLQANTSLGQHLESHRKEIIGKVDHYKASKAFYTFSYMSNS